MPKRHLHVLQNAALVGFPAKLQACVYGEIGDGYFRAIEVEFGLTMDREALASSRTFEEYAGRCQHDL